jgi:hypothetical protein
MNKPNCKICGVELGKYHRFFCSPKCQVKFANKKSAKYQKEWQRLHNLAIARIPNPNKTQCKICGLYYNGIANHIRQAHKQTDPLIRT